MEYLYISSHDDRIVGGYDNIKGDWLKNSITTLQQRPSNEKGKVVIRAVNSTNTQYINAASGEYINNKLWLTAFKPTLTPFVPMRNEECIFACHIEECTNDKLVLFYRFKNCPHSGRMIFTVKNEKLTASFNPICGSMYEGAKVLNGYEI